MRSSSFRGLGVLRLRFPFQECRFRGEAAFLFDSMAEPVPIHGEMEFREFEDLIAQSTAYLVACNDKATRHFGVGNYPRYEYDLRRGEIWWSENEVPMVRGKLVVVGTHSTKSDTWLWAWANPHFADIPLGPIDQVRDFGVAEGIAKLSEEKWAAEDVDGWEMTSVSARLLEAQGGYRSPNKLGALFLLFNELAFIAEEDRGHYLPLKREKDGNG